MRILLGALALFSVQAHAVIITIEPDDYASGTNISNIVPGVTLSRFTNENGGTFSSVYATQDSNCTTSPSLCVAVTGQSVFGTGQAGSASVQGWNSMSNANSCFLRQSSGMCNPSGGSAFSAMLISFSTATDFVQLSGYYNRDYLEVAAYDVNGTRLFGTFGGGGPNGGVTTSFFDGGPTRNFDYATSTISSISANIAYVLAGSWSSWSSLDALSYNDLTVVTPPSQDVPEPGTVSILGLGLVGLLAARRGRGTRKA